MVKKNIWTIIISFLVALIMALSVTWDLLNAFRFWIYIRNVLIIWPIIYVLYTLLIKVKVSSVHRPFKKRELIIYGLIIVLALALAFLIYYPGIVFFDTITQIDSALGKFISNWHPIIETFLFVKIPLLIHESIVSITLYQECFYLIILLYLSYFLRKHFFNMRGTIFFLLILLFNPIFFTLVTNLLKDVPFSGCMLLMVIFTIEIVLSNEEWLNKVSHRIIFFIVLFGILFLRHNGLLCFLFLLVYLMLYFKKYRRFYLLCFIALISARMIFYGPVLKQLHIYPDGGIPEAMGLIMKQNATYYMWGVITDAEDQQVFANLAPKEVWVMYYKPNNFNDIRWNSNVYSNYITGYTNDLIKIWLKYSIKNPTLFLRSLIDSTHVVWGYTSNLETAYTKDNHNLLNDSNLYHRNPLSDKLNHKYEQFIHKVNNSQLRSLYMGIGDAFIVIIFSLGLLIIKAKTNMRAYLPYVIILVNSFFLMFAIYGVEYRLLYPQFLAAYLLLAYSIFYVDKKPTTAVIIGAGPAGLSAAYEMSKDSNLKIIILEKENQIGGIAKTIKFGKILVDLGPHRLFTKSSEVQSLIDELMPVQGKPSFEDKILKNHKNYAPNGPDPTFHNNVLLIRNRLSRIYYQDKFFDYPVNINLDTIKKMGFHTTYECGISYLKARIKPHKVKSLEDFYINRFGTRLYKMFFQDYTTKLWGVTPDQLSPDWGSQRVKGVSITKVVTDAIKKSLNIKNKEQETSLIDQYYYPKKGIGQLWQKMLNKFKHHGGKIIYQANVTNLETSNNKIVQVEYESNKKKHKIKCDYVISSMPIVELIDSLNPEVPSKILNIAHNLPYRNLILVYFKVKKLLLKNDSQQQTINHSIPDSWIYIQDNTLRFSRLTIFNNFSPFLVEKPFDTVIFDLEYFCSQNDSFWQLSDDEIKSLAVQELVNNHFVLQRDILDVAVQRVEKAYPAYYGSYAHFDEIITYLNRYDNLYCIGRNGQHHYNNMDHSMLCGLKASFNIKYHIQNKDNIWNVNTEQEYHEKK